MSRVLPILFNTDMVRAILDGRKTVTRRAIKVPEYYPHFYKIHNNADGAITCSKDALCAGFYKDSQVFCIDEKKHIDAVYYKAPCKPGDILCVRETWCRVGTDVDKIHFEHSDTMWDGMYLYKADGYDLTDIGRWHPSIHMPKAAARIWLKVTDVRVERLQDITEEQAYREGGIDNRGFIHSPENEYDNIHSARDHYTQIWNSTIKKPDLDRYGWDANLWVWVIEFERCEKPEEI